MNDYDFLEGVRAAQSFYKSQYYGGFDRSIRAEDVIKLFLPPVVEQMTQIAMPLPKPRQKWIAGFKEEQANILRETP